MNLSALAICISALWLVITGIQVFIVVQARRIYEKQRALKALCRRPPQEHHWDEVSRTTWM